MIRKLFYLLNLFLFLGCSDIPSYELDTWESLIDPKFNQAEVVKFYTDQVKQVPPGSKEEILIYAQLQKALKKAGNNKAVNGKSAKLSGYIVPVDIDNDKVSKFLFFPTQAACIHVPASPANQTIYVHVQKDKGIFLEDAYEQITVYGKLQLKTINIATGTASYIIEDAITALN